MSHLGCRMDLLGLGSNGPNQSPQPQGRVPVAHHHGNRVGWTPLRQERRLYGRKRTELTNKMTVLRAEIDDLDRAILDLTAQRRAAARSLARARNELWPRLRHRRGRAPTSEGVESLPPLVPNVKTLWARELRAVCRTLLSRAGRLTLSDLHAQLHAHGYAVGGPNPVKVLADAMRYETACGRTRRVRRGCYEAAGGQRSRSGSAIHLPPAAGSPDVHRWLFAEVGEAAQAPGEGAGSGRIGGHERPSRPHG